MSGRALVACVGNVFFQDDGFGSAVARRLLEAPLPPGVTVTDYGIRGLHLAYELLEPHRLLLLVDTIARGTAPGTLHVVEPEIDGAVEPEEAAGAHGMTLPVVLATVKALGGALPRVLLVGCEPACVDEGMGLSEPVAGAVAGAAELVRELLRSEWPRSVESEEEIR